MKAHGVRVVVFGLPDSGKSSLLGAFLQAGKVQPADLKGQIVDQTGRLAELQTKTYEDPSAPRAKKALFGAAKKASAQDVLELPFRFEDAEDKSVTPGVLIDTAGDSTLEILDADVGFQPTGPLAQAIFQADCVVLVIDVGVTGPKLEEAFQKFAAFLKEFQKQRGARTDISGLPVYLVLNKCDLLARKTDTFSNWLQRIEEGKRKIDQRFHQALAQHAEPDQPFGNINLELWATATHRPTLADRPGRPTEPFGVAELFRQIIDSADDFSTQRESAQFILSNTILGLVFFVLLMLGFAGIVYLNRPTAQMTKYQNEITMLLPAPKAPRSDLYREPVDVRLAKLKETRDSELFNQLVPKERGAIDSAIASLEDYLTFTQKLKQLKHVSESRYEVDVRRSDVELDTFAYDLGERKDTWADTDLVRNLKQREVDSKLFKLAVKKQSDWFQEHTKNAEALRIDGLKFEISQEPAAKLLPDVKTWASKVDAALALKPTEPTNRLEPGREIGPDGAEIVEVTQTRYDSVYALHEIGKLQRQWDQARSELKEVQESLMRKFKIERKKGA